MYKQEKSNTTKRDVRSYQTSHFRNIDLTDAPIHTPAVHKVPVAQGEPLVDIAYEEQQAFNYATSRKLVDNGTESINFLPYGKPIATNMGIFKINPGGVYYGTDDSHLNLAAQTVELGYASVLAYLKNKMYTNLDITFKKPGTIPALSVFPRYYGAIMFTTAQVAKILGKVSRIRDVIIHLSSLNVSNFNRANVFLNMMNRSRVKSAFATFVQAAKVMPFDKHVWDTVMGLLTIELSAKCKSGTLHYADVSTVMFGYDNIDQVEDFLSVQANTSMFNNATKNTIIVKTLEDVTSNLVLDVQDVIEKYFSTSGDEWTQFCDKWSTAFATWCNSACTSLNALFSIWSPYVTTLNLIPEKFNLQNIIKGLDVTPAYEQLKIRESNDLLYYTLTNYVNYSAGTGDLARIVTAKVPMINSLDAGLFFAKNDILFISKLYESSKPKNDEYLPFIDATGISPVGSIMIMSGSSTVASATEVTIDNSNNPSLSGSKMIRIKYGTMSGDTYVTSYAPILVFKNTDVISKLSSANDSQNQDLALLQYLHDNFLEYTIKTANATISIPNSNVWGWRPVAYVPINDRVANAAPTTWGTTAAINLLSNAN